MELLEATCDKCKKSFKYNFPHELSAEINSNLWENEDIFKVEYYYTTCPFCRKRVILKDFRNMPEYHVSF